MEHGEELARRGAHEAERPAKPGDARALMADWLSLTGRLLDELGLTVGELQELVAMQGKVNELIDRSSRAAGEEGGEDERPSFRRVL